MEGIEASISYFTRIRSRVSLDVARRASDYLYPSLYSPGASFTASDALSLGTFVAECRSGLITWRPHVEFYEAAYRSVCNALRLRPARNLLTCVGASRRRTARGTAVIQLVRVRRAYFATQDECGGAIEGDLWGLRRMGEIPLGPEARDAVEDCRRWYEQTGDRLLQELTRVDAALCVLLRWNASTSVSFAELQALHGFPELEQAAGDFF